MNVNREIFNEIYSKQKNPYSTQPSDFVKEILKYIKSGRVLDFGCGDGRHSVFLAEEGFEVDAVDISDVAIERLSKNAKKKDLAITAFRSDLATFETNKKYNAVIFTGVTQSIPQEDILIIFEKIKSLVKKGGFNFITAFTQKSHFFENIPRFRNNFFPKNSAELKSLYPDWEIKKSDEIQAKIRRKTDDGKEIKSQMARLIVRKK